ncbi:MAG: DASS family sodium-coupled anion symporter [Flammeovirgaceae bacterium]|nr:DASS family sodium-coupled anion symporter [Flammeovirgaceae bacterium]
MKWSKLIGLSAGIFAFILILIVEPFLFVSPIANKVLALASWMIIWWVSEAVPSPVTSLLPLVILPFFNVVSLPQTATPYASPIIFLFLGGFMIALALEKHRLHERIALNLIKLTGTSGNGIILGFMAATGFISMWISNTATAMMMLPIAQSIIHLIKDKSKQEFTQEEKNFALNLMLMVGYAATLGGLATLIGTPPNVLFVGLLEQFYHIKLNFGEWMLVGVPISIILLFSTYFITTRILFPNKLKTIEGSELLIHNRLAALGKLRKEEKIVLVIFVFTSFFWIFQQAINTWVLNQEILNDTNIGMAGGLLMFITPVSLKKMEFILAWSDTKKLAWGILILFGGGMCLAEALNKVGIIQIVGNSIAQQSSYGIWFIFGLIVITVLLSELMSNVALVQVFVPVVFGIANGLSVDPVLLAMPVTLAASIGFMLPIATPPNAIVFASGHIKIREMVRAGILLDLVSIGIIWLASLTLVQWVYGE